MDSSNIIQKKEACFKTDKILLCYSMDVRKRAPLYEDIFGTLADDITIKMFKEAANGFAARGKLGRRLGITNKQYTTRLHELVHNNLIHKRNGIYMHTAMGKVVDKAVLQNINDIIHNYKKFEKIDLKDSSYGRIKIISSLISDKTSKKYLQ